MFRGHLRTAAWAMVATLGLLGGSEAIAAGSPDGVWTIGNVKSAAGKVSWVQPQQYIPVLLDASALETMLLGMPREGSGVKASQQGGVFYMPMPDGSFAAFACVESPVLAPNLALRYPDLKTYTGQGIDVPGAIVRFSVTPQGFRGMVIGPYGWALVEPLYADGSVYAAYYAKDSAASEAFEEDFHEHADVIQQQTKALSFGSQLREYRAAIPCTTLYSDFFVNLVGDGINDGSPNDRTLVLGQIMSTVNFLNTVLERDVATRIVLIDRNDELLNFDPPVFPLDNTNKFNLINQVGPFIASVGIGIDDYDIGHVFNGTRGGVAQLPAVCRNGKSRGVSGLSTPLGIPFELSYVGHEMGHQFGGNHTFNGFRGSCTPGNRSSNDAFETGAGDSIMSYGSIRLCLQDNPLAPSTSDDPFYHSHSIEEFDFTAATGPGCENLVATGNTPPVIDAGPDFTIPALTPFELTPASASDVDGDTLTYAWEQRDLGPRAKVEAPDDGLIPLFRCFPPSLEATRTLPRMEVVLDNGNVDPTAREKMPVLAREMDFALVVRDNAAGGGGVAIDEMIVNVVETGSPFKVTSPDTCVTADGTITVMWDVAGTDQAPISVSQVNILLSLDGGMTFPTTLAMATANDGSEAVALPDVEVTTARIRIEAVGNIFFDVSDEDFVIGTTGTCPPPPTPLIPNDDCAGAIAVVDCVPFVGSLAGATGTTESSCGSFDFNDAWFTYTATQTGNTVFSTCGSNFDTTLEVFDACGGASLACSDDACGSRGEQSEVTVATVMGEDYLIRVAGSAGQGNDPTDDVLSVVVEPLDGSNAGTCPVPAGPQPPAPGDLDFCAQIDDPTLQALLVILTALIEDDVPELADLLNGLSCATADVNGPVIDDTPGGNGIQDEYELGVVEAIYNDLDYDQNGLTNAQVVGVFETNYVLIFDLVRDAIDSQAAFTDLIDSVDPRLADRLAIVFGGFATLADSETQGAIELVLGLVGELGATVPPIEVFDFSLGTILGIEGDVDGDGCFTAEEYNAFGSPAGGSVDQFVTAALDPNIETEECAEICLGEPLTVELVTTNLVNADEGDDVSLEVTACSNLGNLEYDWKFSAEGAKPVTVSVGSDRILALPGILPGQSGAYFCEVSDGVETVQSPSILVSVEPNPLPVANGVGLFLAASAIAAAAGAWSRRQR